MNGKSVLRWQLKLCTCKMSQMRPMSTSPKILSTFLTAVALVAVLTGGSLSAADHWAYQPLSTAPPPAANNVPWVRNTIDEFVWDKLQEVGIAPSPPADPATLVKRLYYDLHGLAPSYDDVAPLANDPSDEAYAQLVDRLLSSERFAERWARHWLDIARYADSNGFEKDSDRPNAWRYRDWVIDAIHQDMPFDQFTVEQLAGDMFPDSTPEQLLATAFHRQTLTNTEGGTDKEQWRVAAVMDRTETLGAGWLGLTVGCARCHDHKYDDITQREYYQLFAYFNNGDEVNADVAKSPEKYRQYELAYEAYQGRVAELRAEVKLVGAQALERQPAREEDLLRQLAAAVDDPLQLHAVEVVSASSASGQPLRVLEDRSLLAANREVKHDTYTVVVRVPVAEFQRLVLEVLPHDSLPQQGPGLASSGNFMLSEVRVFPGESTEGTPIPLVDRGADFSQDEWHSSQAVDGDPKTGWSVAPEFGEPHQASFDSEETVPLGDQHTLTVVLDQQYESGFHLIGCFRLSVVSGTDPDRILPPTLREIMSLPSAERSADQAKQLANHLLTLDPEYAEIAGRFKTLEAEAPQPPLMSVRVIRERQKDRRQTHILHRGEFLQPGEEVSPGTLATLPPVHPSTRAVPDRLELARWLISGQNPLVPRVAVNHIWYHLFGQGIVRTLNDFGIQGESPTHPKLLDWLAADYLRLDWSRKKLIKLIVMSTTYRQSSHHRPELAQFDPTNRWLYRQNRFRVEAETVRDLYLSASGLLSSKVGGPSVFPPIPAGITDVNYNSSFKWKVSGGENRYRRGMYTFFKRTAPHPNLTTFDCPDSNVTCVQRTRSNTPLGALITLNNEVYHEAAQALAQRVLAASMPTDQDRLDYAFRLCVARSPSQHEVEALQRLLDASRRWFDQDSEGADKLVGSYTVEELSNSETAAWVATARIVLNIDQFITRE